jgi:hypothetical protein
LRRQGYDAYSVAQEHSISRDLWARQRPDVLIFLDVSLISIRRRRASPGWPSAVYALQHERLRDARAAADLVIDTDVLDQHNVVDAALKFLDCHAD